MILGGPGARGCPGRGRRCRRSPGGSRPYGDNAWEDKPTGVIGGSPGRIGTAVGQQTLRSTLSYLNARQMTSPEAYVQITPGPIDDDGRVTDAETETFLRTFMVRFPEHVARGLTVIPQE